jgi:four helix bundle protein
MSLKAEYRAWHRSLPIEITSDVLWKCTAYRLATFVADRSWDDVTKLANDPRTISQADQLKRALDSIGSNYTEAYSRRSANDRCRYYEYSLGSAREGRDRYFKARQVIGEERTKDGLELTTRIIQLLLVTITRERPKPKRRKQTDV